MSIAPRDRPIEVYDTVVKCSYIVKYDVGNQKGNPWRVQPDLMAWFCDIYSSTIGEGIVCWREVRPLPNHDEVRKFKNLAIHELKEQLSSLGVEIIMEHKKKRG